jgi:hypothetical protein
MNDALERALERAGIDTSEVVCVRTVRTAVRVRASDNESVIAADWSHALAEAIRDCIERAGADVVRYRSRADALLDFGRALAGSDVAQVWAWRALGLWTAPADPIHADARTRASQIVRALVDDPQLIVPVLAALAGRGDLARLATVLAPDAWLALASAALRAAGVDAALLSAPPGETECLVESVDGAAARRLHAQHAERIVRASAIARQSPLAPPTAVAVLATLEVDPATLVAGPAVRLAAVRAKIASHVAGAPRPAREPHAIHEPTHVHGTWPERPGAPPAAGRIAPQSMYAMAQPPMDVASESAAEPTRRGYPNEPVGDVVIGEVVPAQPVAIERPSAARNRDERGAPPELARYSPFDPSRPELTDDRVPTRARGSTAFGGLPFLLHILDELEIVPQLVEHPVLAARSGRWAVHRVGTLLVAGAPDDDPAVLAFCGLAPTVQPPSRDEPLPTEGEIAVLRAAADEVAERLRERLSRDAESAAVTLDWTCRRRGEVVADPGWIEMHLSLDDVALEIRRARLDLDPGYVPWLGVVLRIVYE